jgi:hyperpolarization activated cyclic nucleotide-gated potassium channel 2/hyperpolarization activated cyclic nucleotide-gated potassium channel 4
VTEAPAAGEPGAKPAEQQVKTRRERGLEKGLERTRSALVRRTLDHSSSTALEIMRTDLAKVVHHCADADEADPDWNTNKLIQQKLELSLKGHFGGDSAKVGAYCRRIMRPGDQILKQTFNAWRTAVHGDENENSIIVPETTRASVFPIHPHGGPRIVLDVLGTVVIAYDMVAIPFYLAFSQPPGKVVEEPWEIGTFTRLFWTFECMISFQTAYFDRVGELITDRSKCVKNHLRTWFIVDVLTVGVDWTKIILDFMMSNSGGLGHTLQNSMEAAQLLRVTRFARVIRMLRLIRLLKLKKLVHTFYDLFLGYVEWVQILIQIVQMLVMVLVLIHSVGCMWYGFSVTLIDNEDMTWVEYYLLGKEDAHTVDIFDDSIQYHYFTALHWALAQVSPGNINIMPMNWKERVMNIFVLCLTLIVFSSFISSMTLAVTRLRNISATDEKRFAILRRYLRNHKTPKDLAVRIHSFLEERQSTLSAGMHEKDVDLLPLLTKGLYSELMCVKMVPILRMYLVFRQLHSSEAADALMYMICEEACSQRVYGPGERVYVVDDVSRGMYFLTNGVFELREYREEDIEIYRISPLKNLVTATNLGGRTQREQGWSATTSAPTFTVGWLAEFSLFETRSHDTMLLARGYSEVLHVSRTPFQTLLRKFPTLEGMLREINETRRAHAAVLMGSDSAVGDWIRPYRSRRFQRALSMQSKEPGVSRSKSKEIGASPQPMGPAAGVPFSQVEGGPWPQPMDGGPWGLGQKKH